MIGRATSAILIAVFLGISSSSAMAQWAHCEVYRNRAYQAAQASNLAQVEIEQNRYYACVNRVPTCCTDARTKPSIPSPTGKL